jgi:malonyl-CoA O-methyltransferase
MAERLAVFRERPARWLDWHAFAGGSAEAVAQALPESQRLIAEPDAALLARSRQAERAPWWRRGLGRRRDADARLRLDADWPGASVDMVWANMVLHAQPDAEALMRRWNALLAPDGFVMFSTFGSDTLQRLHGLYAEAGWGEPMARLVDMHDIGDAMVRTGFADPVMDQETLTLTWSSPEAALAELRALGHNLSPRRHTGLRTPRWRERLLTGLGRLAGPDGRLALGFELVYGHAYKGQPLAAVGEPVPISLAGLRRHPRGHR